MVTFDEEARLILRSAWKLGVACAPVAFGVTLAFAGLGGGAGPGMGIALAWIGAGGVLYAWVRNPEPVERAVHLHVDARGLFVDGRLAIRAADVRGGWVQPCGNAPTRVHVCGRSGRDVELVVRDAERGHALLRALEIDESRASAHFWTYARPLGEPRAFGRAATITALVLAFGLLVGQSAPIGSAMALAALAAFFLGLAAPTLVTVGADGLLLRWLGTRRFVPWSSVVGVERFDGGVALALEGGRWLTLRAPSDAQRYSPERDAMIERIRVAWRATAPGELEEPAARLLRRTGVRTREWVRSVRSLLRPPCEEGYRVAAMPPERLWALVEDPRVDRAARVGAALALAPWLDEGARERLRSLADACAEPRTRLSLAVAATKAAGRASDADIAATLDGIESEEEEDEGERERRRYGSGA
jgi:hypothetical protein